jgi:Zn-dependent membrane protease YugP
MAVFYIDPMYYLFVAPALLLAIWAQIRVQSAFGYYRRVHSRSGLTGAAAAERVLRDAGIRDVTIEHADGMLSDHYDPRTRTLRLSSGVYDSPSVAALGVAAHEAGHAIQHAHRYAPLAMRSLLVPTASLGSWLAIPLIFLGFLVGSAGLAKFGLVLFGAVVVFQLITLPVEFDASARAKQVLAETGIIADPDEMEGVRSVLSAAGWTYVAAALAALMQLLYYAWVLGLFGRRND